MVDTEKEKEPGEGVERDRPREGDVAGAGDEEGFGGAGIFGIELHDDHHRVLPVCRGDDEAFAFEEPDALVAGFAAEVNDDVFFGTGGERDEEDAALAGDRGPGGGRGTGGKMSAEEVFERGCDGATPPRRGVGAAGGGRGRRGGGRGRGEGVGLVPRAGGGKEVVGFAGGARGGVEGKLGRAGDQAERRGRSRWREGGGLRNLDDGSAGLGGELEFEGGEAGANLNRPGEHDQESLPGDHGEPVERAADTDEPRLVVLVEGEHVETVGGDVVGGGGKGEEPEYAERDLEKRGSRNGEGHAAEGGADQELQEDDPLALGAEEFDEGTPEGFDDPGEVEPARIERDVRI